MSAFDCERHFSTAVVQQFGFHVSSAQRPRLRHQLSSLTEAVGGTWTMLAEMNGGNSMLATCLLDSFFLRAPLGKRARLARLLLLVAKKPGSGAACINSAGLEAASGM